VVRGKAFRIALGVTLLGVMTLTGSSLLARRSGAGWVAAWLSGVLIEAGAAVLFLVPLLYLTRSLERHIEEVREETTSSVEQVRTETTSSVAELTERVSSFEGDIERRLDDIVGSVNERLTDEREREVSVRTTLREAPTRTAVMDALESGLSNGLISANRPPRVAATAIAWDVCVVFALESGHFEGDPAELSLRVESHGGQVLEWIRWDSGNTVTDVMVRAARAVQRLTGSDLEVASVFTGLSDLLEVASTAYERRPIVQLCPPLWAVTTRGIVTYGLQKYPYTLSHSKLREETIGQDMRAKTWGDEESFELARGVALALFPLPDPNEPAF
jgi:hypothetical protein